MARRARLKRLPLPSSPSRTSARAVALLWGLGLGTLALAGGLIYLWPQVFGVIFGILAVSLLLLLFAPWVLDLLHR